MIFEVKKLNDLMTAEKIGEFLTGPFAFEQTWAPNEKAIVIQAPIDSLDKTNHCYWYVENEDEIIAAIGVRENKYGSGGYEMDSDYIAVHKNYRNNGLAQAFLNTIESILVYDVSRKNKEELSVKLLIHKL